MSNFESNPVQVTTGSRLHFGLTRYRAERNGTLNGVGVMLEQPATQVCFRPAPGFQADSSSRIRSFAESWMKKEGGVLPDCEITLISRPPAHSGFGSGTQLAHAIAAGLDVYQGKEPVGSYDPVQIAQKLDRGRRSMIGSYGFAQGGLIVDGFDDTGQNILVHRIDIPGQWRVVVAVHSDANKKFGLQEQSAFDNIVAEQDNRSRRLEHLIARELVPAVESGDFERFCDTVHTYGKLSGEYYAEVQGGIYNGPVISAVVDTFLKMDARGVGQSSWGPAVFAWCESQSAASELISRLTDVFGAAVELWCSPVRNQPARITAANQPIPIEPS